MSLLSFPSCHDHTIKMTFTFSPSNKTLQTLFCLFFSKQNTDNINAMNYHLVNAVSHDQSPKIHITQTDKKGCWCHSLLWISRSYWGHWKIWQATIIRKDRKLCAPGFRCLVASNKQSTSLTFASNHATTCFRKALQDSGCLCCFEEDPRLALLLWNAL